MKLKGEVKMKKVITVLSAIVVLLALVSCGGNKSEEMIETYEKFVTEYNICVRAENLLYDNASSGGSDTALSNADLEDLLNTLNTDSSKNISVTESSITGGTSSMATSGDTKTYSYNDIVVTYKYSDGTSTGLDGTLTVSGEYASKTITSESSRGIPDDVECTHNLTLNNKTYRISYYKNANGTYKSASVDGTAVEVRLLNASK